MLFFFSYFLLKVSFDVSCKLSPKETVCIKCQSLFSGKNKKSTSKRLLKFLPIMISVKCRMSNSNLIFFFFFFFFFFLMLSVNIWVYSIGGKKKCAKNWFVLGYGFCVVLCNVFMLLLSFYLADLTWDMLILSFTHNCNTDWRNLLR